MRAETTDSGCWERRSWLERFLASVCNFYFYPCFPKTAFHPPNSQGGGQCCLCLADGRMRCRMSTSLQPLSQEAPPPSVVRVPSVHPPHQTLVKGRGRCLCLAACPRDQVFGRVGPPGNSLQLILWPVLDSDLDSLRHDLMAPISVRVALTPAHAPRKLHAPLGLMSPQPHTRRFIRFYRGRWGSGWSHLVTELVSGRASHALSWACPLVEHKGGGPCCAWGCVADVAPLPPDLHAPALLQLPQ